MQQAMKAAPRSMLTVRKTNQGAIRLYQKLGFEIVGDLETDGTAAGWVMATSA
jgi:ribosomal protein S18 acetylase RimI-like enzyme